MKSKKVQEFIDNDIEANSEAELLRKRIFAIKDVKLAEQEMIEKAKFSFCKFHCTHINQEDREDCLKDKPCHSIELFINLLNS